MYELCYWRGTPGRGEFVRLALEVAGIAYQDSALASDDLVMRMAGVMNHPPFAPPYLVAGGQLIGQTANILMFLGETHDLAPQSMSGRLWVNQVQLTVADMVSEAHDTHHPIDGELRYEDQTGVASMRAEVFRRTRLPKYLTWFERVLAQDGRWLAGRRMSYADLSLFHVIEGLRFAFPRRMAALFEDHPRVMDLHAEVARLPALSAYVSSGRRLPFSDGIFRHYPELDGPE